jgi:hypothetical protein
MQCLKAVLIKKDEVIEKKDKKILKLKKKLSRK